MGLIIRLCFFMLLSFAIIKTENNFFKSPEHLIKEVKISGIDKEFLKDFDFLNSKLIGQSIYKTDIIQLTTLLKEDIRLENITITSEGLDTLNIFLERKKPKYYLQYKGKTFLIDKNNIVYGELNDEKISSLPFILIKENKEFYPLVNILDNLNLSLEERVSQLYHENEHCVNILLTDGTILKTNNLVTQEKYNIGRDLYLGLAQERKIEYIDLRFDDYIVKYAEVQNE